jgi:hypothetical protein
MKFASDLWVYQLLTPCLPGCDHEWEALGPLFLDARLYAMRADGVDEPRASWDAGAWRAAPSPRIPHADPLHARVLALG